MTRFRIHIAVGGQAIVNGQTKPPIDPPSRGPIKPATGQRRKNRSARLSMMLTQMARERWNGDPEVKPPPLVKPTSRGDYGECPDETELPWHLRQKRKP